LGSKSVRRNWFQIRKRFADRTLRFWVVVPSTPPLLRKRRSRSLRSRPRIRLLYVCPSTFPRTEHHISTSLKAGFYRCSNSEPCRRRRRRRRGPLGSPRCRPRARPIELRNAKFDKMIGYGRVEVPSDEGTVMDATVRRSNPPVMVLVCVEDRPK
jgi:hypothetical protein